MKNKALVVLLSILMFCVGIIGGAVGITYFTLPYNEELVVLANGVYSASNESETVNVVQGVDEAKEGAVSIHFLELGNKYTGDCTYIKVGKDIDILIDCGSKSTSIPTVSAYLNKYVTDGILEYVIITHAHQDHYAGFATSVKVNSIFDLYECKNIIDFAKTNQKPTSSLYNNYIRERNDEIKNGANHYTALDIVSNETDFPDGKIMLDAENNISLQILNSYYYTNKATTENDYSVCTMLNQGEKHFLFTGDLEEKGEEYLVRPEYNKIFSESEFSVELYKAGHHGSKTSSSMTLLNAIKPKVVCVCCCAGSSEYTKTSANQFPTRQFIINVSQFTDKVFVTSLCVDYDKNEFKSFNGNIVIISQKEESVGVYCSNNTTLLKDTDWFKNNRLEMCKTETSSGELLLNSSWY